jgi:hypothetical protein
MRWRRRLNAVERHRPFVVERHRLYAVERHRLYAVEASTLCGGEASTQCGGEASTQCGGGVDSMRWRGMNYRYMCVIFYWGCRFDSFLLLLVSVPYYIQTSSVPSPCSPCHLSLLACRLLCIIVRALDICVRPPFGAFCTHITLRRRSKRFRRFKRWVWSPCGTHAALTQPSVRHAFFFRDGGLGRRECGGNRVATSLVCQPIDTLGGVVGSAVPDGHPGVPGSTSSAVAV